MTAVTFREMDEGESRALLERNHVGRIAFAFHDRVNIHPISYVYRQEWLACRTEPGTKMDTLAHSPYVAFEVDEVLGPYDWKSVVVQGTVYRLDEASQERDATITALRSAAPEAFTDEDPAPHRVLVFRVYLHELTGRAASTAR